MNDDTQPPGQMNPGRTQVRIPLSEVNHVTLRPGEPDELPDDASAEQILGLVPCLARFPLPDCEALPLFCTLPSGMEHTIHIAHGSPSDERGSVPIAAWVQVD